jgi:hypothetical protein
MIPVAPLPSQWKGRIVWCCPLCRYDSSVQTDVLAHIRSKHVGQMMPCKTQVELSIVPVPVIYNLTDPLVSCVMVTKDRRSFVKQSIECFMQQTYQSKELVVVDDGTDSVRDLIAALDPTWKELFQYYSVSSSTVGRKRNVGCAHALGSLIALWDDDEWQSPNRLAAQVNELLPGKDVCGCSQPIFADLQTRKCYTLGPPHVAPGYCSGSMLLFRKSLWYRNRFPDQNVGEDTVFLQNVDPRRVQQMKGNGFNVSFIHSGNTATKSVTQAPYIELDCKFPVG